MVLKKRKLLKSILRFFMSLFFAFFKSTPTIVAIITEITPETEPNH